MMHTDIVRYYQYSFIDRAVQSIEILGVTDNGHQERGNDYFSLIPTDSSLPHLPLLSIPLLAPLLFPPFLLIFTLHYPLLALTFPLE